MRVVVVEDSALLRDGLTRLLADHGHDVKATADTETLPAILTEHQPRLVVLDIRLPPTFTDEGLRAAQHIHHATPEVGVLLLSQYVVERYTADLLDGVGGVGYLLKDRIADVREFLDAVQRVGDGGTVLDPYVIQQLLSRTRRADPLANLTDRERDVLTAMTEGRSNNAIAARLHLSEGGIEKHISALFNKLGLAPAPDINRRVLAVTAYLRNAENNHP